MLISVYQNIVLHLRMLIVMHNRVQVIGQIIHPLNDLISDTVVIPWTSNIATTGYLALSLPSCPPKLGVRIGTSHVLPVDPDVSVAVGPVLLVDGSKDM